MNLRLPILGLVLFLGCATGAITQTSATEQGIVQLSKNKWQWMADKDVVKLEPLFHDRSKFVHMSGTWKKAEELDIIKTGRIWYKQADVHIGYDGFTTASPLSVMSGSIDSRRVLRGSDHAVIRPATST